MSRTLIVTPAAERDVADAKRWYDDQRDDLGDEFVASVGEAIERICRLPLVPATVFQTVRRVLVRKVPYGVFYRVDDSHIHVIAVYHSRRNPRGWQARAGDG